MRQAFRPGDDVELVMHAVDEIDVGYAARAVHRLGARRAPAAVGVRRTVSDPAVSLHLDDAPGHALARRRGHDEQLAQKVARDRERVAARVEAAREFRAAPHLAALHSRHQFSVKGGRKFIHEITRSGTRQNTEQNIVRVVSSPFV